MNRSVLLIGALAMAAACPLAASTLTFSDRPTWLSQVTNLTNLSGGPEAAGGLTSYNNSAGLISTDLQIVGYNITTGTVFDLQTVTANASQTWYQWGSGSIIRTGVKENNNTIFARITFTNPVSAFGFNVGAGGNSGAPASVTISPAGLSPVTISTNQQPSFAFFGVTSNTQTFTFADIFINDTGRYLILDDVSTGTLNSGTPPPVTETAEPGTLLQVAMGAALVATARRRRQGAQQAV
ncbi:MAG: hypothetical protein HYX27_24735 [Acidobacteria bacterium]|nr:hypothetical protein [Acidobacteriota bacterium]